jgi:hypothetical protein
VLGPFELVERLFDLSSPLEFVAFPKKLAGRGTL